MATLTAGLQAGILQNFQIQLQTKISRITLKTSNKPQKNFVLLHDTSPSALFLKVVHKYLLFYEFPFPAVPDRL